MEIIVYVPDMPNQESTKRDKGVVINLPTYQPIRIRELVRAFLQYLGNKVGFKLGKFSWNQSTSLLYPARKANQYHTSDWISKWAT
jgi:hypothetical protein